MPFIAPNLAPAVAEIFLAVTAMGLLMLGVFSGDRIARSMTWLAALVLMVALVLVASGEAARVVTFAGLFVADRFALFMKALVLIGAALTIVMSLGYQKREEMGRCEYPIVLLFATLGMMMMISANDLMSLYVGLELQSLALYVAAAFRRDSLRATEAGLKYFVLGALSSGLLLYGASLVYGFTGTTNFDLLAAHFARPEAVTTGAIVGLAFVVAGLAFKISAVPFHMWTPDVYEGAPTPVTAFFAAAPKIAAMALFIRLMIAPFGDVLGQWQQIVIFIALASMLLGSFAAIQQRNIKRLMAYSSIGHIGFALVGLAAGDEAGIRGVLVYMTIYLMMTVGTFCCILSMRRQGRLVESIDDLAGLSKTQPMMALALGIFMFSMAGIPPLGGFFGKLYVFLAAVEAGLYWLAVIGVLTSVVAAFYYLRIVKLMYFDEPAEAFDRPVDREIGVIVVGAGIFILFFFLYPGPLLTGAAAAAASLFAG